MSMTSNEWFDEYGHFLGELPEECWQDCSAPGQDAAPMVEYWRKRLGFEVPREKAIEYLSEFGAWPIESDEYDTGLNQMNDDEIAGKVLWCAACDMREQGEWFGLIH
jgi:hypothetical protein